ncbi:hypothetical protein MnTg02_02173 [bacterium MnTg02]|nr:hypothetical protein MnTg02_02173 [bacterium MnTg02]
MSAMPLTGRSILVISPKTVPVMSSFISIRFGVRWISTRLELMSTGRSRIGAMAKRISITRPACAPPTTLVISRAISPPAKASIGSIQVRRSGTANYERILRTAPRASRGFSASRTSSRGGKTSISIGRAVLKAAHPQVGPRSLNRFGLPNLGAPQSTRGRTNQTSFMIQKVLNRRSLIFRTEFGTTLFSAAICKHSTNISIRTIRTIWPGRIRHQPFIRAEWSISTISMSTRGTRAPTQHFPSIQQRGGMPPTGVLDTGSLDAPAMRHLPKQ